MAKSIDFYRCIFFENGILGKAGNLKKQTAVE
jgi:hypothetical protein